MPIQVMFFRDPFGGEGLFWRLARCSKRAVMYEPSKDVQRLCVSRHLHSPSFEIADLPRSPAFSSAFFPPVQGGAEALWRRSFKIAVI